jgi:alkanesulfonate monooxygenase SsuD/methylene tetrahydromethanopterin reductase-like flavin-dependent oxidoreductase (luciferase family)
VNIFVFDLMPYSENVEHLRQGKELPWPLPKKHFKPEVAAQTYAEHLEAWEALDRLGYYGVAMNEHHTSPYGLMNSPNLLAASAAQRTKRLKLLVYGNLLPLHNPVRLAEELAMLDCLSNGRLIAGFARGIPREYKVYDVPLPESRARFEEAFEIVRGAWTEEVFSFEGKFWSFKDVALWPRPLQQPHPPVWVPVSSSQETIEWAARNNVPITPGIGPRPLNEDVTRYYARCLRENGHEITPGHLILTVNAYVADSKQQALDEAGPSTLYFNRTLFSHGSITEANLQRDAGYLSQTALDYVRPENMKYAARAREDYRDMTMESLAKQVESWPWGTADEVIERIIEDADHFGGETMLVSLNRGGLPQHLFLRQIERFAREVLPALKAHKVSTVPLAA